MNSNEPLNMEQKLFDELLSESRFDDSVCNEHHRDLRLQVMEAFDRSQRDAKVRDVRPLMPEVPMVPVIAVHRNASQLIGVVASLAACLLGVVSLFNASDGTSSSDRMAAVGIEANATIDPGFAKSLAEVQALQKVVPPELFFHAVAICQKEYEAKRANAEANQMRLLYESLLRPLPLDSSKG